jgi:hypothetical protein
VIETIFGARLDPVARTVIDGTIDSAKLYTVSIITKDEHGNTREKPVITSGQETTGMMSDLSTSSTTKALICQKIQIPGTFSFPSPIICDDSYLEHRLRSLPKANILQEEYTELNQNQMDILNEDWVQGQHLRLACAQLLAGCILVDQEQILLVNCKEFYGKLRTLDPHYERFENNYSSTLPDENISVYQYICVCNVDEDNSHKLIIGSFIFSSSITSSARFPFSQLLTK